MSAFDKLKDISKVSAPKQKIVPVKEKKRDSEKSYTLWLDKELLKDLKLKAIETDDNMKSVVEKALRAYLA